MGIGPSREAAIHGAKWTRKRVVDGLIAYFRQFDRGIYAPGAVDCWNLEWASGRLIEGRLLFDATGILGRRSEKRMQLLAYCRERAGQGARMGASIEQTCTDMGWNRSTFDAHWREAADAVAIWLNLRIERLADGSLDSRKAAAAPSPHGSNRQAMVRAVRASAAGAAGAFTAVRRHLGVPERDEDDSRAPAAALPAGEGDQP